MRTLSFLRGTLRRGFTLVETIGVLAILMIILAICRQRAIGNMQAAYQATERQSLSTLADALTNYFRISNSIPSTTNWATAVWPMLSMNVAAIQTNAVGNSRALLLDPTAVIGPPGGANGLPYTQASGGSVQPTNLRLLFVSSVAAALPSLGSITFSNLWNCPPHTFPVGWPSTWGGTPDDIVMWQLDFHTLFYRLDLNNLDPNNNATWWISGSPTNIVLPSLSTSEVWVMDGSNLFLNGTNAVVSAELILHNHLSYTFENGQWIPHVNLGIPAGATVSANLGLQPLVDAFLAAPTASGASQANAQLCVDNFFHCCRTYGNWAQHGFSTSGNCSGYENDLCTHKANCQSACSYMTPSSYGGWGGWGSWGGWGNWWGGGGY